MRTFQPDEWRGVGPDMPEFEARLKAAGVPYERGIAQDHGGMRLYGLVILAGQGR